MTKEESLAHALAQRLLAAGVDVRADGGRVEGLSVRIDCFWHDPETAFPPRTNSGNERYCLELSPPPGATYDVTLTRDDAEVADGETDDPDAVVACVRAWRTHGDLSRLVDDAPFIGAVERAHQTILAHLDPALRGQIVAGRLWVSGDDRRCGVFGSAAVRFQIGDAQVARGEGIDDVPAAVAAWLIERVSLQTLAARFPAVAVERHAEALEVDPLDWHWRHVRDRIADPDDVLAPLRPLIERLAQSPIATRFYSYSSLNRFCFSASSHYPWIDGGLPKVCPAPDGKFWVDGESLGLDGALQRIEATLRDYPIRPRFGTSDDEEAERLAERLALRPTREPCGAYDVWVIADPTGARRCYPRWVSHVDVHCVRFVDERGERSEHWPTVDEAAAAIRRFCETGAW